MADFHSILQNTLSAVRSGLSGPADEADAGKIFSTCGLSCVLVYLIFWIYFQNFYFHWLRSSRNFSSVILIPGLTILLLAYWRGYKALHKYPTIGLRPVLTLGAIAAIFASLIPSFYSSDLLSYINYGWQQLRYHANPYCLLIAGTEGFGKDPMLTAVWTLTPPPYGFAFVYLTKIVCLLGNGNLAQTILVFKLLDFIAWLSLGAVVYYGARKFALPRPDLSLYLYLWSPLVLIHTLSCGHNDALMTLFVMSSFLSAACNVFAAPLALLVIGILIKYVWIFAVPFLLLYLIRKCGWWSTIANICAASAIFVGFAWPYRCRLSEVRWYEMGHNLTVNANSLPAVIQNIGNGIQILLFHSTSPARDQIVANCCSIVKMSLLSAFVVFASWLFLKACRSKDSYSLSQAVEYCVLGVMVAACLVSAKFYPWYIVMFFPLSLWLPQQSEIRRLAVVLSCTQLFAITMVGHGHSNNFLLLTAIPFALSICRWRKNSSKAPTIDSSRYSCPLPS